MAINPRGKSAIATNILRGRKLRQMRQKLDLSQSQLATIVGCTPASLKHREQRDSVIPTAIAVGLRALLAAKEKGAIANLSATAKRSWRQSRTFKQPPPFEDLPARGTACGCGDAACGLNPVRDGDWPKGHLWCFHGSKCNRRVYLDATGQHVESPGRTSVGRVPIERCSGCGRNREINTKFSTLFGKRIYTRRCRKQVNDPPLLKHDPVTYWWEQSGKLEQMQPADIDHLHGRSKHSYPDPRCQIAGCPRLGMKMQISSVLHPALRGGGTCRIVMYRCRAPKAHAEYRVESGELATRVAMGRYRWIDSLTGATVETETKKRALRKDCIMPGSQCLACGGALSPAKKSWKVMEMIRGRRRWKRHLRRWTAQCVSCGRVFYVRSDGQIRPKKNPRWQRPRRGLTAGTTLGNTAARITVAASLGDMTPSNMAPHLYPEQGSKDHARHSTVVFLGRYRDKIKQESSRLSALSETERNVEVRNAYQKLA